MLFDLKNPLHKENARIRLEKLIEKRALVTLKEKKPRRTTPQNSYLHLILSYFASQTGNTLEYVKQHYYKRLCNPTLFVRNIEDPHLGWVEVLESSARLTTEEMTLSIERFRNWAAAEGGIYLPDAENPAEIQAAMIEVERWKEYL